MGHLPSRGLRNRCQAFTHLYWVLEFKDEVLVTLGGYSPSDPRPHLIEIYKLLVSNIRYKKKWRRSQKYGRIDT